MTPVPLAIVGLGKIAHDQHLPAILANGEFKLAGVASPEGQLENVPSHVDLPTLLKAVPSLQAIAVCTPPQVRYQIARFALERGLHVLLEKPPCVTVSEAQALVELAQRHKVALLAAWHSRFAPAVEPMRIWAAARMLSSVAVSWKEDVRIWHPGQSWIWRAGGQGVFDPGINALSILTRIVPGRLTVQHALLSFPKNSDTPIAASLHLLSANGVPVTVELDFLHAGEPEWQIDLRSTLGRCQLSMGGNALSVDGHTVLIPEPAEYRGVYAHFAQLVRERALDIDLAPLQLVADSYLCGQRSEVAPFVE
jgi:D-galactose 1-dehydrogenase